MPRPRRRTPRSRASSPRTRAGGDLDLHLATTRRRALAAFERLYVVRQLRRHGGSIEKAARRAGISLTALRTLIRRHGIDPQEYLPPSRPRLVVPRRPEDDA